MTCPHTTLTKINTEWGPMMKCAAKGCDYARMADKATVPVASTVVPPDVHLRFGEGVERLVPKTAQRKATAGTSKYRAQKTTVDGLVFDSKKVTRVY